MSFLPGEIWQIRRGDEFQDGNLYSNVQLNCQKSAEAIVLPQVYVGQEGPNVRRLRKFEVLDGYAKKAENRKGLSCKELVHC